MVGIEINIVGYLNYAHEKTANTSISLAPLISIVGDPRYNPKLLEAGVVRSTLLQAVRVWEDALTCENNRRRVNMTYDLVVLRVCSAFRTFSNEAACVIAEIVPLDILVNKTHCLYDRRVVKRYFLKKWQQR